jgi:hypothetical protein
MRIEAVTVCVDYADFLEVTLPSLISAVDDLVVVTSPRDARTRELCSRSGVRVACTDTMFSNGRRFSLGAAINAGLSCLPLSDWALVVDADIVLPRTFHKTVQHARLDPAKLYGADRVHCRGRAAWDQYCTADRKALEWEVQSLRDFPMGARIRFPDRFCLDLAGYAPCGYFQLWNAGATGYRDYPADERGTAEGSDLLFSSRFPRNYRELIPEIVCIQLETDQTGDPVGVNWAGRRTLEFSIERGEYRR